MEVVPVLLISLKRSMLKSLYLQISCIILKQKFLQKQFTSILDYELNPLEKEASKLKKQIGRLEREILNIIEYSSDTALNLDAEMIKSHLATKQDEINKINSELANIAKQVELKQNESIMNIIEFSIKNFEEFYYTLSVDVKKLFFHTVIREVHVTRGEKTKDRRIKDYLSF